MRENTVTYYVYYSWIDPFYQWTWSGWGQTIISATTTAPCIIRAQYITVGGLAGMTFCNCLYYFWFTVIPEKQVNSHFCITEEYHFLTTLRKRNNLLVQIKKKWSSVQFFFFYKMERCHLYDASGKATGYKNRNEGVSFSPLRLLSA